MAGHRFLNDGKVLQCLVEPSSFASPAPGLEAIAQMGSAEKLQSKTVRNAIAANLSQMPPPRGSASVNSSLTNSNSSFQFFLHQVQNLQPEEDDREQLEKWTLRLLDFMDKTDKAPDAVRKKLWQGLVCNAQEKVD